MNAHNSTTQTIQKCKTPVSINGQKRNVAIHTMEHYSATEKCKVLIHTIVNLKNLIHN